MRKKLGNKPTIKTSQRRRFDALLALACTRREKEADRTSEQEPNGGYTEKRIRKHKGEATSGK